MQESFILLIQEVIKYEVIAAFLILVSGGLIKYATGTRFRYWAFGWMIYGIGGITSVLLPSESVGLLELLPILSTFIAAVAIYYGARIESSLKGMYYSFIIAVFVSIIIWGIGFIFQIHVDLVFMPTNFVAAYAMLSAAWSLWKPEADIAGLHSWFAAIFFTIWGISFLLYPSVVVAYVFSGLSFSHPSYLPLVGMLTLVEVTGFICTGASLVTLFMRKVNRDRDFSEDRLRTSEQRYRELIEFLPVGVAIDNLSHEFTFVNPALAKILGYDGSELVSKQISEFLDKSQIEHYYNQSSLTRDGKSNPYDLEFQRKDDKQRILRVTAVPNRDYEGQVIGSIAVTTDVTEQTILQRERLQQQKELEIYASLLRHDLGHDLQIVISNLEILQMLSENLDKDTLESIDSAFIASERMIHLIKAFSQSEDVQKETIVSMLQRLAREAETTFRNLTVNVVASDDIIEMNISKGRFLPAVFENLFRNAVNYAGENTTIQVEISRSADGIEIMVSDDGPGIASEIEQKLFQRGVSTSGGGLGLYLSRRIIESIDGTIDLLSHEEGKGAVFRIRLPLLSSTNFTSESVLTS
jgi:PAS domain S-box-containing protein